MGPDRPEKKANPGIYSSCCRLFICADPQAVRNKKGDTIRRFFVPAQNNLSSLNEASISSPFRRTFTLIFLFSRLWSKRLMSFNSSDR